MNTINIIIIIILSLSIELIAQETTRSPASFDFDESGLQFMTADSLHAVIMRFRMQNQVTYNSISENDFSAASTELAVRRLRLRFGGTLYKYFSFNIQFGFARRDLDGVDSDLPNIISDAIVYWNFSKNAQIGFGQTKLPGNRQRVISSGDQQFADRSIVNSHFSLDRDFGIQGFYNFNIDDVFVNIRGAVSNGDGRYAPQKPAANFCYTGRVEILPFGKFTQGGDYFEGDLIREPKPKLSLASTFSHNEKASSSRGQLGTQLASQRTFGLYMADAVFKYAGLSIYAEYAKRFCDEPYAGDLDGEPTYVFAGEGLLLQASYYFGNNLEFATRTAKVTPDKEIRKYKGAEYRRHISACFNYYISFHRAKIQFEITHSTVESKLNETTNKNWIGRFNVELGI